VSKPTLQERLAYGPIVIDGSMEAVLRSRGYTETPIEHYNLKNPVLIERIHCEFLEAGAEIIQANTRSANALTLAAFKLSERVYEINRKGVWLARTASQNRTFVAGVVGPIGKFLSPVGKLHPDDARSAFVAQIHALLDGKCDLLLLKSFIDIEEIEIALDAARHVSKDIPIIAQKSFPEDGGVLATDYPREIARRLAAPGVIAFGTNGTVGPQRMRSIVQSLYGVSGHYLSAQPDIGIPTLVDGVPMYNATIEYVASSTRALIDNGVTIIGVDGGGMPEHVRAIAEIVNGVDVGHPAVKAPKKVESNGSELEGTPTHSRFFENLGRRTLVTVELDIPRGTDMSSVIDGAAFLERHGIDAVNITDGARARLRMSPTVISHLVQSQTGMEAITHLACRDRNMVGLQSELLGAHALGLRNVLCVTGDPTHIGDYPYATSVYDVDAVGLIRAAHRMNNGLDLAGNPIGARTSFMISCACNPVADDMEREISRLERKAAEGAHVAFTQPIFETSAFEHFLERTAHIPIRIMVGVIPLRTAAHAEFLHHEVPGMKIPDTIQRRMRTSAQPSAEGVSIAVEFLEELSAYRDRVAGIYLMPPFKRYEMVVEILERAGTRIEQRG
jgi:homocysteine S-methyltransferase